MELFLVRRARPDLLVCTGDLVDGPLADAEALARALAAVPAPLGRYGVFGNHEHYTGSAEAAAFFTKAGFVLLNGRRMDLPAGLVLVGVDDPAGRRSGRPLPTEAHLLDGSRPDGFTVLLKHRPEVAAASRGKVDLQLSGHTHAGQIAPFSALVRLRYRYFAGTYRLDDGRWLHVNRGSGTWGPALRLPRPCEVTVIDLVAAAPVAAD